MFENSWLVRLPIKEPRAPFKRPHKVAFGIEIEGADLLVGGAAGFVFCYNVEVCHFFCDFSIL
jgi:hypothetical protein